jgi:hypothetical protein
MSIIVAQALSGQEIQRDASLSSGVALRHVFGNDEIVAQAGCQCPAPTPVQASWLPFADA